MRTEEPKATPGVHDREWLPVFAWCLLCGACLNVSRFLILPPGTLQRQPAVLLGELAYWLLWVPVFWPFAALVRRYPIERPHRLRRVALFVLLGPLPTVGHGVLYFVLVIQHLPQAYARRDLPTSMAFDFAMGYFMYWIVLALQHVSHYYRTAQDAAVRTARLEEAVTRARIEAVRAGIRLDLVVARLRDIAVRLREEDPQSADDRVVRLGRYLRRKLEQAVAIEGVSPPESTRFLALPTREGWFNWRSETLLLVAWTAATIASTLGMSYVSDRPRMPLAKCLESAAIVGLSSALWVILCAPLGALIERYPIQSPRRLRRLLGYASLGPLFGALHTSAFFLLGHVVLASSPMFWETRFRIMLLKDVSSGGVAFASLVMIKHVWHFSRRYREEAARAAELGAQLATAQLRALQMQLHPHFLFNTLHSISELVHENPADAEEMTLRLADLLRLAAEGGNDQLVTLDRELIFLERYLGIQKIRFQDRLTIEIDVAPDVRSLLVPNLVLQPLVENAIKHGIARRLEGGSIAVRCARRDGHLQLEVIDEGTSDRNPAAPPAPGRQPGLGLRNTESRLRRLYGKGYEFRLDWNAKGGASARLAIPAAEAAYS